MAIAYLDYPCRMCGKPSRILECNVARMICTRCASGETAMADNNDISVEAGLGIAFTGVAAFFATIDAFWLKSYHLDLTKIDTTQFGWMTFFAALSALFTIGALGLGGYVLSRKIAPMVGYVSKVMLGVWGIAMTVAVLYLIAKSLGIHVGV